MRPELVHLLARFVPFGVADAIAPSWFTFVGIAGVLGLVLILRAAREAGIDRGAVATAVLAGYVAAVASGIVVSFAIDLVEQLAAGDGLRLRWAGMTSFWGYLGGGAAVAYVLHRHRVPMARFADLSTMPLGIALVWCRLGCFTAGCDYGKVSSLPWAVRFPAGSPAWHDQVQAGLLPADRPYSLPVQPTELYEALLGVAIAIVATLAARGAWGRARAGRVFLAGVATYAIGRFVIEEQRGDVGRGFFGPLSSGQLFSLGVLGVLGLVAMWPHRRRVGLAVAAAAIVALVPTTARADDHGREGAISVGVLAGYATPLNRRNDQVPPLAGPSLSIGLHLPDSLSAWLDLDSLANHEAVHGTALVSLGWDAPLHEGRWQFEPRVGFGSTLVNFHEPAFQDVNGFTMRFEGTVEASITGNWVLWVRPLSFDLLNAADLGGPIFTWQVRVGFAYEHRKAPRRMPPPPPAPAPAPAPAPQPSTQPLPGNPY